MERKFQQRKRNFNNKWEEIIEKQKELMRRSQC